MAPAVVPIAVRIAEDPKKLVKPIPIKGAANPPVTPINAPPPIVASPIHAKRFVLADNFLEAACSFSFLKRRNFYLQNHVRIINIVLSNITNCVGSLVF